MTTTATTRTDIYTRVTDQIIAALERGVRPWQQPWSAEQLGGRILRPLRHNGQKYSGINILTLWMETVTVGYRSPYWLTFKQIQQLGGSVQKGEHGSPVVYASTFKKTEQTDAGEEIERELGFLKEYRVFNAEQATALPAHFYPVIETPQTPLLPRIEQADGFFANTGAEIRHGGTRAFYSESGDYIQMPPFETFRDAESFAAVLGHEAVHWTKAPHRLHREFGRKRWGDEGYAMEELVAELGSAFLCADLQITPEVREDHASYLESWLKVAKSDKRALFTAASHASKAVDFLHGLQPQPAT